MNDPSEPRTRADHVKVAASVARPPASAQRGRRSAAGELRRRQRWTDSLHFSKQFPGDSEKSAQVLLALAEARALPPSVSMQPSVLLSTSTTASPGVREPCIARLVDSCGSFLHANVQGMFFKER